MQIIHFIRPVHQDDLKIVAQNELIRLCRNQVLFKIPAEIAHRRRHLYQQFASGEIGGDQRQNVVEQAHVIRGGECACLCRERKQNFALATRAVAVGVDLTGACIQQCLFAVEIAGATDVKYVPGYFPFTEPSIEVHIKHPKLGWFELGGSGIFRPEVTKAMGVDVPVAAWGIGIDRMALMALGLNDLRELFCEDVERVRLRKARF